MSRPHALIVDDEADIRELVEMTLMRMQIDTTAAENLNAAYESLNDYKFDLCLTDMRLPDGDGIDLVRHMTRHHPATPVAMITAHGNMDTAVEALKAGAFDFVSKPLDLDVLRGLVGTAIKLRDARSEPEQRLTGESAPMRQVRATIAKLARSQAPVFVSGESGTGKELAARLIHEQGPRAEGPFVPVNCGAIPSELMESEFFGHKKGSFTGAVADKAGMFQAAAGGTLFLDEVADLPLPMQVKLLRAIQEKAVRPVGSEREVAVDVRILSASHKDLNALVGSERFRQDLYYRLNVINLHVPPLRERREDIPVLAKELISRLARDSGTEAPEISAEALQTLGGYGFPGNVRELENILERAMTLCDANVIAVDDLALRGSESAPEAIAERASLAPAPTSSETTAAAAPGGLNAALDDLERQRIVAALDQVRWNKTKAARLLGISFGALRYRMQKLGLD
ncbi:MAG: sigma-54-dependent transcriptional regulator [Gammaproteobacteria bacterium]